MENEINSLVVQDNISNEEIQKWEKEQAESLVEHPEIVQMLIANQTSNVR